MVGVEVGALPRGGKGRPGLTLLSNADSGRQDSIPTGNRSPDPSQKPLPSLPPPAGGGEGRTRPTDSVLHMICILLTQRQEISRPCVIPVSNLIQLSWHPLTVWPGSVLSHGVPRGEVLPAAAQPPSPSCSKTVLPDVLAAGVVGSSWAVERGSPGSTFWLCCFAAG